MKPTALFPKSFILHPSSFILSLGLAAAVAIVYWPACRYDFVNYDDPKFIAANDYVRNGLTRAGLVQAFTGATVSNWHPLTMFSHMLVCECFGAERPGWHHAVNIALHAAASVLLFLALLRMTAARWPSAAVAALFALHPLHVESVAWIAERKDVLSAVFWMLTLLAYARYARQPALGRYLLVFAALALGLMSKPMLVTLPLVLLLLDYWPLRRFGGPWGSGLFFGPQAALAGGLGSEDLGRQSPRGPSPRPGRKSRNRRAAAAAAAPESPARFPPLVPLLLEKLPLLALSVAVSIVTYRSQTHAMSLLGNEATLPARLSNALVGYASYLGMTFWPYPLAALYPFVKHPPWQAAAAAALLAAITAAVLWPLRRRRYLAVGWFWYLGTLVPVIGLVQVGFQSIADRYTYLPLIGIFIMAAWGAADLTAAWSARAQRRLWIPVAAAVLVAAAVQTRQQLRYWSDSERLFTHDIEVVGDNPVALWDLSAALEFRKEYDGAMDCYRRIVKKDPEDAKGNNRFGRSLLGHGRVNEAVGYLRQAARLEPEEKQFHYDLASALLVQGKIDEALAEFHKTIALDRDYAQPYNSIAWIRATHPAAEFRNAAEAIAYAQRACKLSQNRDPHMLDTLAAAYARGGQFDKAVETARFAVALAKKAGDTELVAELRKHWKQFDAHQPVRDVPNPPLMRSSEGAK
ncbi:MAG: tetratricopeptide repeat protein [Thermoguttaceae bacterium]